LRNQGWGHCVLEKGPTIGGEVDQGILLMLLTGGQDGEKAFHIPSPTIKSFAMKH
jgi:hypothetical protein